MDHASSSNAPILSVANASALVIDSLSISFARGRRRQIPVVDNVSLSVGRGEVMALVGESGSGKSVTAMSIARLLGPEAVIDAGQLAIGNTETVGLSPRALRSVRGASVGFVFQEPMTSLNPLMTVGDQIIEPLVTHRRLSRETARERAAALLADVGFPSPRERLDDYPHQLSGGQRQRAMIAIAIACDPVLLVADEPTTALDVTTQAQVLTLIDRLRRKSGMGVLLITHDLGVVDGFADRVAVMYAGRIVETGPVREVFARPAHPYTRLLLRSLPRVSVKLPVLPVIEGTPPSPAAFPSGCRFHPRCPDKIPSCTADMPPVTTFGARKVSCFRAETGAVEAGA